VANDSGVIGRRERAVASSRNPRLRPRTEVAAMAGHVCPRRAESGRTKDAAAPPANERVGLRVVVLPEPPRSAEPQTQPPRCGLSRHNGRHVVARRTPPLVKDQVRRVAQHARRVARPAPESVHGGRVAPEHEDSAGVVRRRIGRDDVRDGELSGVCDGVRRGEVAEEHVVLQVPPETVPGEQLSKDLAPHRLEVVELG